MTLLCELFYFPSISSLTLQQVYVKAPKNQRSGHVDTSFRGLDSPSTILLGFLLIYTSIS